MLHNIFVETVIFQDSQVQKNSVYFIYSVTFDQLLNKSTLFIYLVYLTDPKYYSKWETAHYAERNIG